MKGRSNSRKKRGNWGGKPRRGGRLPDKDEFFSGFLVSCHERREKNAVGQFFRLAESKVEEIFPEIALQLEQEADLEFKQALNKRNFEEFEKNQEPKEKTETKNGEVEKEQGQEGEEDKKVKLEGTEAGPKEEVEGEPSSALKMEDKATPPGPVVTNPANAVKDETKAEPEPRRRRNPLKGIFQQIKIPKKGFLFFKLNERFEGKINLLKIGESIIHDFYKGKTGSFCFLFKIIPIEACCYASFNNFEKFGQLFIDSYLKPVQEPHTLSLFYKCRNNSKFSKGEFIETISEQKPEHFKQIEYKGDYVMFVEIVHVRDSFIHLLEVSGESRFCIIIRGYQFIDTQIDT